MKGTNLGEFEELVLLTIASLVNEAYSVSICDELKKTTKRSVKLGVVHAVLNRLEEKEFLKSKIGEATRVRGGKRKAGDHYFPYSIQAKRPVYAGKKEYSLVHTTSLRNINQKNVEVIEQASQNLHPEGVQFNKAFWDENYPDRNFDNYR